MTNTRCILVLSSLAAAVLCVADPGRGVARLLPEVKTHIASSKRYLDGGQWDYAAAHADLVLISDDVSVNLDVRGISQNQRKACTDALKAACSVWESALGKTVRFHLEADPSKADLKVVYRPNVFMGTEPVAGLTTWRRGIKTLGGDVTSASFRADMSVRERGLDLRPLSFEVMRQETEHELGHVLGLDDSDRVGDLMGELDPSFPVSAPREYEVTAVRELRDEASRLKVAAAAKKGLSQK